MFTYSGRRGHILHTALLVGGLSSCHTILATAITIAQNRREQLHTVEQTVKLTLCAKNNRNVQLNIFKKTSIPAWSLSCHYCGVMQYHS